MLELLVQSSMISKILQKSNTELQAHFCVFEF